MALFEWREHQMRNDPEVRALDHLRQVQVPSPTNLAPYTRTRELSSVNQLVPESPSTAQLQGEYRAGGCAHTPSRVCPTRGAPPADARQLNLLTYLLTYLRRVLSTLVVRPLPSISS